MFRDETSRQQLPVACAQSSVKFTSSGEQSLQLRSALKQGGSAFQSETLNHTGMQIRHNLAREVDRLMEAKHEIHDGPAAGGGGGALGVLQLLDLGDRRLEAAAFLLAWGCIIVVYGTVVNRSVNPEHIFLGFFLFTIGAALALLTLGGGGRAAARAEGFLRAFF
ncbi:hypothetical protein EJB05_41933, partial [Eragrostis curvula]